MNGRIYDPVLGIFFTPDPLLQFPDFPIGLNPYSYCLNSPLSFVDPTGYSIDGFFFNFVRIMAMTVVTIASGGNPLPAMLIATTFATMDGMHAMAKGANVNIFLDFVAPVNINILATSGIGKFFGPNKWNFANEFMRASAHAINNGVSRLMSGGKFEHGFLSGFVSSLGGSYSPNVNGVVNTAMSATLGGTAEALGGGKFSNGAVTGAFVYLLNHASHQGDGGRPQKQEQTNQYTKTIIPFGDFSIEYTLQEGFGFNGNTFYRGYIEINNIQGIWYVSSYAEVIPSNAGTHMDYWANLKVYQDGKNVDYSYFNMKNIAPTYYAYEWTRIGYGYAKMPLSGNVQIQINIGGSSYSFFKGHSNQIIFSKTYTFPK